jgi:hypothetical protein
MIHTVLRMQAAVPEDSSALSDDEDFDCSSSTQQTTSCPHSCTDSPAVPATVSGNLSKRGRRSSVLRGAALPGHLLFSSHVHTSRSLLLAKMSKARRKAYLAYTQQMAEHFAEVGLPEVLARTLQRAQLTCHTDKP